MTHENKPFFGIEKIVRFAIKRPFLALTMSLALLITSLLGLPKLKLELDLYDSYNKDFTSLVQMWKLREEFQDSSSLFFLIEWDQPPSGDKLCQLIKKIDTISSENSDTKSVFHLFKARKVHSEPEKYWYPLVLENPCLFKTKNLSELLAPLEQKNPYGTFNLGEKEFLVQVKFNNDFKPESTAHWLNQIKDPSYKSSAIGPATFRYYISQLIKKDSVFHILIILFFIVFIRLVLGTWKGGMYYVLTLVLTSLTLAGLLGLIGIPLDVLSNNLFLLTAIAGTADFLFVSWGLKKSQSFKESFYKFSRPCFFTTVTTMIGFLSLLTSDLVMIRNFGVAAALGAALEWFFTLFTWPALVLILKHEDSLVSKNISPFINRLKNLSSWVPPVSLSTFFILIAAAAPFLFPKLIFEEDPIKNFPSSHQLSQDHKYFSEKTGWMGGVHLVFSLKKLTQLEIEKCLLKVEKFPEVQNVENPYQIQDFFIKDLNPLRQEAVKSDLLRFGGLSTYFGSESVRSLIFLKDISPRTLEKLSEQVSQFCPESTQIVGQSQVYKEVSAKLSKTLLDSFVTSLVIVFLLILFLQFKLKNKNYFSVAISILAGPLAMITLMSFFNIPLSPMNSLFLAVLVGITGDNAIQYLFASKESDLSQGVGEIGTISVVISLAMIVSSLFFLFQTLIPMKLLGILFSIGFFLNLVGDLWLLKGLLKMKDYLIKRSIGPKREEDPKE